MGLPLISHVASFLDYIFFFRQGLDFFFFLLNLRNELPLAQFFLLSCWDLNHCPPDNEPNTSANTIPKELKKKNNTPTYSLIIWMSHRVTHHTSYLDVRWDSNKLFLYPRDIIFIRLTEATFHFFFFYLFWTGLPVWYWDF